MRRVARPRAEFLERRSLLSGATGSIPATALPLLGPAVLVRPDPGFDVVLTTDKTSYAVGEPVDLTLTETNTTDHPISVATGDVAPLSILQNGSDFWDSDGGPHAIHSNVIELLTVAPGQSVTSHFVWNGASNDNPLIGQTGTFEARFPVGPGEAVSTTFTVQPPPISLTLTTDKTSYAVGDPVHMTVTETNNTDHVIDFTRTASTEVFT